MNKYLLVTILLLGLCLVFGVLLPYMISSNSTLLVLFGFLLLFLGVPMFVWYYYGTFLSKFYKKVMNDTFGE